MAQCLQQPKQQVQSQAKKVQSQTAKTQATTGNSNTQVGSTSTSSGSTSAVQKVGIPQLLGIAVENGAINNSVSGTTMTLSTTPYGFVFAFAKGQDTQTNYENYRGLTQLGVSAAFNVASSSDPLQSATRKAVSEWQAKYTFRDTSARSKDEEKPYKTILSEWAGKAVDVQSNIAFAKVVDEMNATANKLYQNAWISKDSKLKSDVSTKISSDSDTTAKNTTVSNDVLRILEDPQYQQQLSETEESFVGSTSLFDLLQNLSVASDGYKSQLPVFNTAVQNLTKGLNGDVVFGQNFPTSTTTTSSSTKPASTAPAYLLGEFDISYAPRSTIVEKDGTGGNPATHFAVDPPRWIPSLTGNFISSFYTDPKKTLNEKTFRGGKFAVMSQWDVPPWPFKALMSTNDKSKTAIALSSSYERLQENQGQKGKKADIVLGNVKLSLALPGGVSFPLAVSFANATSQVKGNYVVGNFGFNFNLDSLAALAKVNH
jgi:hypothetical protein